MMICHKVISVWAMVLLSACQQQTGLPEAGQNQSSPIAAVVNGNSIYESDIDAEINRLPDSLQQLREDPKLRAHLLRTIIRRYSLSQKAMELGLDLDPGIRLRIEHIRRQILIEAAKEWRLANMKKLQHKKILEYYEQHRSDFTIPEQIHARHILVSSREKALELIGKLKRKRDIFQLLAARESLDDGNKARGGDLNWFPRGVMVKAFDAVAFDLKLNELSEPVETKFGWHVIEVLGRHPEANKSLEEVKDEIVSILQQVQIEQWFKEIENASDIKILRAEYQADSPISLIPEK